MRTDVGYGIWISITVSEKVHQTCQKRKRKRKLTPNQGFDDEKREAHVFFFFSCAACTNEEGLN